MTQVNGTPFGQVIVYTVDRDVYLTDGYAYIQYNITTNPGNIVVEYSIYTTRTGKNSNSYSVNVPLEDSYGTLGTGSYNMSIGARQIRTINKLVGSGTLVYNRHATAYNQSISFGATQTCNTSCDIRQRTSSGSFTITIPALPVYTISYDKNGGSGNWIAPTTKTYGISDPTAGPFFSDGAVFHLYTTENIEHPHDQSKTITVETRGELSEWNTQPDGSGTSYNLSQIVPNNWNQTCTLYAIWNEGYSTNKYIYPALYDVEIKRTKAPDISDKDLDDLGTFLYIKFYWRGYSDDYGTNFNKPECNIYVNNILVDSPTLNNTDVFEWKHNTPYSTDFSYNIKVELCNTNLNMQTTYSGSIGTAIYPIDIYGTRENNENKVYMGVMTAYVQGQSLTVPNVFITDIQLALDTDAAAGDGADGDICLKLQDLNWYNNCVLGLSV